MSDAERRAQYIWRPDIIPEICVMLFIVLATMVLVPATLASYSVLVPYGDNLKAHPEDRSDQELGLDGDGNYYLNRQPIQRQDLPRLLAAIFETRTEDRVLYVRADKRLRYARILDAFEVASHRGVRVAAMVVDQRPSPNVH
jgi:biopolymer transport protein ExbD